MKYSVIIPVYNAEQTLKKCVYSLLDQNYLDAEIILINDGSWDESGRLCQEFAKHYKNILCIEQKNRGVSAARNAGIQKATGEYILFVDSDDYVADGYFEKLDQWDGTIDLLLFSCCFVNGNHYRESKYSPLVVQDLDKYYRTLCELIYRKRLNAPWNKRYKREIMESARLRFDEELSVGEDTLFNLRYALLCRNCAISEELLYFVNEENPQSLSRKIYSNINEQVELCEKKMRGSVLESDVIQTGKKVLLTAVDFLLVSEVYSKGKRMHNANVRLFDRWKNIRKSCRAIKNRDIIVPKTRYCQMIYLPVRWGLLPLIDVVSMRLAKGSKLSSDGIR